MKVYAVVDREGEARVVVVHKDVNATEPATCVAACCSANLLSRVCENTLCVCAFPPPTHTHVRVSLRCCFGWALRRAAALPSCCPKESTGRPRLSC